MLTSYRTRLLLFLFGCIIAAVSLGLWWSTAGKKPITTKPGSRTGGGEAKAIARAPEVLAIRPVQYLPLTPEEAIAFNAERLPVEEVGPSAEPFRPALPAPDFARASSCLAEAVYYEAASQDLAGQRAVAQVVLNRLRHPAFPATVCSVVYQGSERATGCQFTFTCDGSLLRPARGQAWATAQRVALAAMKGYVFAPVGYATHYHANWVVPYWAASLTKATSIKAHIFYRWKGRWGQPLAFRQAYAGAEPNLRAEPMATAGATEEIPLEPSVSKLVADGPEILAGPLQPARQRPLADDVAAQSKLLVDEQRAELIPSLAIKQAEGRDRSGKSSD